MSVSPGYGCGDPDYHFKGLIHVETFEIYRPKHWFQLTFHLSNKLRLIYCRDVNRDITWYIKLLFNEGKEIIVIKILLHLANCVEQVE